MVNYQKELSRIVAEKYGKGNTRTFEQVYIDFTGTLRGAIFFSQLLYWTPRTKDKNGWIHKTYLEWYVELGNSKQTTVRISKKLKKMGILETKVEKVRGIPVTHYHLIMDNVYKKFSDFCNKKREKRIKYEGKKQVLFNICFFIFSHFF